MLPLPDTEEHGNGHGRAQVLTWLAPILLLHLAHDQGLLTRLCIYHFVTLNLSPVLRPSALTLGREGSHFSFCNNLAECREHHTFLTHLHRVEMHSSFPGHTTDVLLKPSHTSDWELVKAQALTQEVWGEAEIQHFREAQRWSPGCWSVNHALRSEGLLCHFGTPINTELLTFLQRMQFQALGPFLESVHFYPLLSTHPAFWWASLTLLPSILFLKFSS